MSNLAVKETSKIELTYPYGLTDSYDWLQIPAKFGNLGEFKLNLAFREKEAR